jgi:exopolysaccharide biosynthesis protein
VGIIDNNHFVFIVVDGRSKGYSMGVSLTEFAQMFQQLGCMEAYNLDGGGSSTMYFMGRVVNNPLGRNKERGTSDILFIRADA